jgi:hypothetical protein
LGTRAFSALCDSEREANKERGSTQGKNKWEKAKQPSATEKSENFRCKF